MANYRECISAAAEFLGLGDMASALAAGTESELSESDKKELDLLVGCAGFVVHEIASEYIPLFKKESVAAKNGFVDFSRLEKTCLDVVCVRVGNVKKRFKPVRGGIEIFGGFSGSAEMEYSFAPATAEIDESLEWGDGKVSARLVGYGIACEYCIINGMSEAVMWDKRYKDALSAANRTKAEMRVKIRRWI